MSWWTQERDAVTGELKGLSPKTKLAIGAVIAILLTALVFAIR
jgi:hypothetical protein